MSRAKIGDIVEIETERGLVYAQYTHKLKSYGALLRVFDAFYESRPSDLVTLLEKDVLFSTFYPLNAALRQGLASIAFSSRVAEGLRDFPTFRCPGLPDPTTGEVDSWYLWRGGEDTQEVGEITPEIKKLPIRGVWNHALLVKRIESGWRPELSQR